MVTTDTGRPSTSTARSCKRSSTSALVGLLLGACHTALVGSCQQPKAATAREPTPHSSQRQASEFRLGWVGQQCVAKRTRVWPIHSTPRGVVIPPIRTAAETQLEPGDFIDEGFALRYEDGSQFAIRRGEAWFLAETQLSTYGIRDASTADNGCEQAMAQFDGLVAQLESQLGMTASARCQEVDLEGNWVERPCRQVRAVSAGETLRIRLSASTEFRLSVAISDYELRSHLVRRRGATTLGCSPLLLRSDDAVVSLVPFGPEGSDATIELNAHGNLARTVLTAATAPDMGQLRHLVQTRRWTCGSGGRSTDAETPTGKEADD